MILLLLLLLLLLLRITPLLQLLPRPCAALLLPKEHSSAWRAEQSSSAHAGTCLDFLPHRKL
jgi:hypothetical protein